MAIIGPGWEAGHGNQRTVQYGNVRMEINTDDVLRSVKESTMRAANAIGVSAQGMIREQMNTGYHDVHNRPYPHTAIRITSALINDVKFAVEEKSGGEVSVTVGNNLDYAMFVHEGTRYLRKRPYIYDAIKKGCERLVQICDGYLK